MTVPLNAREKPPVQFKNIYKKYQKIPLACLEKDNEIVDLERGLLPHQEPAFSECTWLSRHDLRLACLEFVDGVCAAPDSITSDVKCVESTVLPGACIIPNLLPLDMQRAVLDRLLHRDLGNPVHKTNVHFHHDIEYPESGLSFFDLDPNSSSNFTPVNSSEHKALTTQQFLSKKLRWMTLGGQYDWTKKRYPDEDPPPFPSDLQRLLHGLFPQTTAEAAIVNLYSPGDVLSLHRDVSESCDSGLISISFGCDGLFMLALGRENDEKNPARHLVIRLRSGDAVYMEGEARYAWHGVPMIIPDTCPDELTSWPSATNKENSALNDGHGRFDQWRGWLASKRINLNVRQMFSSHLEPETG